MGGGYSEESDNKKTAEFYYVYQADGRRLFLAFGGTASVLMACGAAAIAALEEFLINMISKELSRDVKSIFTQKRNTAGKSSCN